MAKTYEFNTDRGTFYEIEDDPQSGGLFIHTKQDVSPVVEWAKKQRNSGKNDKVNKQDFNHYAIIPAHVELELRQKGINIYKKENTKRLLKEINTNYPHLKVTNMKHSI